jgi:prolyl-tRNA editing enzyme YbaK/EbsC (Cys-tRNA(Pro) deacylase)
MENHANVRAVQDALEAAGTDHPKPVRTLVDTALEQYPVIWAAGGVPRAVFPISYPELVRITAGTPAEVA